MSSIDYTKIERPVEPAFANEDPGGWVEVLVWEEARADRLEQENAELREALQSLSSKGVELLNIDDIEDEEDSASIHANFNDELIKIDKLLNK